MTQKAIELISFVYNKKPLIYWYNPEFDKNPTKFQEKENDIVPVSLGYSTKFEATVVIEDYPKGTEQIRLFQLFNFLKHQLFLRKNVRKIVPKIKILRDNLVQFNTKLVFSQARRFRSNYDLAELAYPALIRSVDNFNPFRAVQFSTYVTWSIKNQIYRELTNAKKTECVNLCEEDQYVLDQKADADCSEQFQVNRLIETRKILGKHLKILSEREIAILSLRYGLNYEVEPMTLEEIAKMYKVSKERIRQIQKKALFKLRDKISA